MAFSYVVSNHKSTAVNTCCGGSFTGPNDINLIVAKSTLLEIYLVAPEGLKLIKEYTINGKIVCLQLFKPYTHSKRSLNSYAQNDKDLLFILTHKYNVCILECIQDETGNLTISTRAHGNVQEKIGRPSEAGMIASIDPDGRVIGLQLYDGLFKIIKLDDNYYASQNLDPKSNYETKNKGEFKSFNINIEERKIVDLKFLEGFDVPTIALINQDSEGRHFRTYKLMDRDLVHGPWSENNIEAEASILIPVPLALGGGVLIVGQESIMYFKDNAPFAIRPPVMKQNSITCYCKVDPNGSRYILGDMAGRLFVLLLEVSDDGHAVRDLSLTLLGEGSIPESLTYLDNGVLFLGSRLGDSQLIRLRTIPTIPEQSAVPSYVEVLERFTNLGPIVDMVTVDAEPGSGHRDQLVTCSGAFKDGSLRILRDGIGINERAALELPGNQLIRGLWSLKNTVTKADAMLVTGFSDRTTRVLSFNGTSADDGSDEVEEIDLPGIVTSGATTLYCGDVVNNNILQITTASCLLIDRINSKVLQEWTPPNITVGDGSSQAITVAACNGSQICLASGRELYYLELRKADGLVERGHVTCDHEISCLDCSPLGEHFAHSSPPTAGEEGPARFCAAGFWGRIAVKTFSLPRLEECCCEEFAAKGDVVVPRSLLLCRLSQPTPYSSATSASHAAEKYNAADGYYLMVALGNGTLYYFRCDPVTGSLRDRKRAVVGTRPPSLKLFRSGAAPKSGDSESRSDNVFVCSDRPTIIYARNGKLIFSAVNLREVCQVCPFDSPTYPDSLILVPSMSSGLILIGTIDEIRKLHIRTIALGESPRRIAYHEATHTYAILGVRIDCHNGTTFIPLRGDCVSVRAPAHSSSSTFAGNSCSLGPGTTGGSKRYQTLDSLPPSGGAVGTNSSGAVVSATSTFGDEAEAHSLIILQGQTLEPLWAHHFQPYEFATSLTTCHLSESASNPGPEYYVVGTAMVYPEEPEPRQGRILVFEWVLDDQAGPVSGPGGRLTLISEKDVSGAPYTLVEFLGHKLLATVNSTVRLFEWTGNEERELRLECSHFNNILALYAKTRGDSVLVGDLMRSLTLLTYKGIEGAFEERARDYDPAWTCAVEIVDDLNYLAAENSYNLYACQRDAQPATLESGCGGVNATAAAAPPPPPLEDERRHLCPVGRWHLGEFVNVIRRGCLVTRNAGECIPQISNPLLMGTVSGSVHLVLQLTPNVYELLSHVEQNVSYIAPAPGKIDHEYFRSFSTDQKTERPVGFLDGDVIESFLDLSLSDKERVIQKILIDPEDFPGLESGLALPPERIEAAGVSKMEVMDLSGDVKSDTLVIESTTVTSIVNGSTKRLVTIEEVTKIVEDLSRLH